MLEIENFSPTKYATVLDIVRHSGDSCAIGTPEYDHLEREVYDRDRDIPVLLRVGGRFIAPDSQSGIPPGVLALPEWSLTDLDLPVMNAQVYIVKPGIARMILGY